MNLKDKAVVQLALDVLMDCIPADPQEAEKAIARLRQLLEQPEQEHDHALEQALTRLQKRYSELEAKVGAQPDMSDALTIAYMDGMFQGKQMAKREWVGLTDDEVEFFRRVGHAPLNTTRAIEAKLREKNGGEV